MSAINATSSAVSSAITSSTGSSELDRDAFMLLLVTQFQYQDPLNPMEDKEFIAQLAQFSSLEQLMNLNESMVGLTDATNNQQMINATSYIGKAVDVTGTSIGKQTDVTTGETTVGTLRYAIGENSVKGQINVFDSNNNLVASVARPAESAGTTHEFTWDGKMYSGEEAPDGVYRIVPTFYNADGDSIIDYDATVDGLVSGVINEGGITYLSLSDGRMTPLSEVRRVSTPTVVSTTPDPDAEDNTDETESATGSTEENSSSGEASTGSTEADSAAGTSGTDNATNNTDSADGTNSTGTNSTPDASGATGETNTTP